MFNFPTNSPTGVTNFNQKDYHLFSRAIEVSRDSDLWIERVPFGVNNIPSDYSLHCKSRKDLSTFWKVFHELEVEYR